MWAFFQSDDFAPIDRLRGCTRTEAVLIYAPLGSTFHTPDPLGKPSLLVCAGPAAAWSVVTFVFSSLDDPNNASFQAGGIPLFFHWLIACELIRIPALASTIREISEGPPSSSINCESVFMATL